MNISWRFLVIICICYNLSFKISGAQVSNQAKYDKVVSDVIARANGISDLHHWPLLKYDPDQLKFAISSDQALRSTLVHATSLSGIYLSILPESLQILAFQRDFPEAEYKEYDLPPKPQWHNDQAISEATTWIKCFLGRVPNNVGGATASYAPLLNLPKYYEGTWSVSWRRVDSEGHFFMEDGIKVALSEKFGIITYACMLGSKYSDGQKISVSQNQAIEVGRLAAQTLLKSPLTADWSEGLNLLPEATAELLIVNPNHILRYHSIEEWATAGSDETARLAWVVEYRASNVKGMGRHIEVWVDAETKDILGGEFHN